VSMDPYTDRRECLRKDVFSSPRIGERLPFETKVNCCESFDAEEVN
jgi:hypothetical protein